MKFFPLILLFTSNLFFASPESLIKKGNTLYKKGKFEDALKYYTKARISMPIEPALSYNIGNIHYKKREYDKAIEAFEKAMDSKNKTIKENSYFNMGNCYFLKEDYLKAIENYKKALELDPEDEDAKINLELARKKLKDQAKKQEQKMEQKQQAKEEEKPSEKKEERDKQKEEETKKLIQAIEDKEKEVKEKQKNALPIESYGGIDW